MVNIAWLILVSNANYTLAYFTLKENNHWTADNEEGHYYALVRTEYPSAYPVDKDDVYTNDVNKFADWKYVFDDCFG